jgi:hypothetical protein
VVRNLGESARAGKCCRADEDLRPWITFVCLRCLLDDHPEIGRGIEIAREGGVADLNGNGAWIAGRTR